MLKEFLNRGSLAQARKGTGGANMGDQKRQSHDRQENDTAPFYDAVVDRYHLFYRDWQATLQREGMTLRRTLPPTEYPKVLDASCGTGTQSIALAQQGYTVTAADINTHMIEKSRENAVHFKVDEKITFVAAGFLELPGHVSGPFDAVITKGNALPHLLTDDDLQAALRNFYDLLRPGGAVVVGMRDYDMIIEDRIRFVPGQFHDGPDEQFILFDIWDYDDGPPPVITFNKFIVNGIEDSYTVTKNAVKYRALRRAELEAMLAAAGFVDCSVETQNWEQVYTARRP
jgi:SAM-dependent methyltransferase